MTYFSITSKLITEEAKKLGFEVEILQANKNFYVVKGNGKEVYFKSNDFGGNSALGYKMADDKELTNIILDKNGIKIPRSIYIRKEEIENFDISKINLRFPLVTKPVDEGHGNGVTTGIESLKELDYGIKEALKYGNNIIIQEFIFGDEHRILVIGNKVVLGIKRIPAFVIGDGIHNINELIEIENKNPLRGDGYENVLSLIKIDENLIRYISKKGYNLETIPKSNEYIQLRGISNIGAGGVPENITDILGKEFKKECLKIAKLFGLKVIGLDIISQDIKKSLKDSNGAIIEINSNPGFGGDKELIGVNTAKILLEYIFLGK